MTNPLTACIAIFGVVALLSGGVMAYDRAGTALGEAFEVAGLASTGDGADQEIGRNRLHALHWGSSR